MATSKHIAFLLAFLPAQVLGQSLDGIAGHGANEERAAIVTALSDYLRVTDELSEPSIGKAFHPLALLMTVSTNGRLNILTQDNWWERLSNVKAGTISRDSRIVLIDTTGLAAVARIDITTNGRTTTDYFSLMKVKDGWRIVNKTLSAPL